MIELKKPWNVSGMFLTGIFFNNLEFEATENYKSLAKFSIEALVFASGLFKAEKYVKKYFDRNPTIYLFAETICFVVSFYELWKENLI